MEKNISNSKSLGDMKKTIKQAEHDGLMSKTTSDIMVAGLGDNDNDVWQATTESMAITDDIDVDEVNIVVFVTDASPSMYPHTKSVRTGQKACALEIGDKSHFKQADKMMISHWTFADDAKCEFAHKLASKVLQQDFDKYTTRGSSTAEYDAVFKALSAARTYAHDLMSRGIRVRIFMILLTDGEDNNSRFHSQKDVHDLITALMAEEIFTPAVIGFTSGGYGFSPKQIAENIGVPEGNVLDINVGQSDAHTRIKNMFGFVSKSIIAVSTSKVGSSNTFFA